MSFSLFSLSPMLFIIAFWLLVKPFLDKEHNAHRAIVAVFAVVIGIRYLLWRYFYTVTPGEKNFDIGYFWVLFVFSVEVLAFVEVVIFLLIMSRTNERHKEADHYQKDLFRFPSVDVFIPTYNEEIDVLEKTIIGAKNIDYPNFKVWVLDDTRRQWLKEHCAEKGVGYLTRPDNRHAKAGNMNSALKHTSGELFAIFDADFIPAKNFLMRTIGFFIHNDDIGIVQTPQHFFNKDPIQSNLYLSKVWPDEQRLFFDAMAPCRDSWNAAFCCGSCSIIRREAIEKAGGIPTSSITEDLLTTLTLLTFNYRTIYLNEKLSQGMSSESVEGFFVQRARWCQGGIQCFFVKEGPLRAKGLSPLQRLLFAPYGWLVQPITRFMLLMTPIVYLWTGLSPMYFIHIGDILFYQLPMLLLFVLAIRWLASNRYIPLISTAVGVFSMFRMLPVVVASIIKPFGVPFKVTPKGSGSDTGTDYYILYIVLTLIFLTLAGIMINLVPEYQILTTKQFFPYAIGWATFNILLLGICALICIDAPRKRLEERFPIEEEIDFRGHKVVIEDLSLGGCKIRHGAGERIVQRGDIADIHIPDISGLLSMEIINSNKAAFMVKFINTSSEQRDEIIAKLFTGKYNNQVAGVQHIYSVISQLFLRAFGKEME
ncbi:MAG: glycosyltransferase [Victivallaceae bacterium]|nr:glycosyltransferase [Victivallaceae bacterium]